jgi:hypothetical protein
MVKYCPAKAQPVQPAPTGFAFVLLQMQLKNKQAAAAVAAAAAAATESPPSSSSSSSSSSSVAPAGKAHRVQTRKSKPRASASQIKPGTIPMDFVNKLLDCDAQLTIIQVSVQLNKTKSPSIYELAVR